MKTIEELAAWLDDCSLALQVHRTFYGHWHIWVYVPDDVQIVYATEKTLEKALAEVKAKWDRDVEPGEAKPS